jgi:hypothetical protein
VLIFCFFFNALLLPVGEYIFMIFPEHIICCEMVKLPNYFKAILVF